MDAATVVCEADLGTLACHSSDGTSSETKEKVVKGRGLGICIYHDTVNEEIESDCLTRTGRAAACGDYEAYSSGVGMAAWECNGEWVGESVEIRGWPGSGDIGNI